MTINYNKIQSDRKEKRTVGEYSGQTNEERYEKEIGHGQKLLVKVKLPLS
jgi:hypothetical protein